MAKTKISSKSKSLPESLQIATAPPATLAEASTIQNDLDSPSVADPKPKQSGRKKKQPIVTPPIFSEEQIIQYHLMHPSASTTISPYSIDSPINTNRKRKRVAGVNGKGGEEGEREAELPIFSHPLPVIWFEQPVSSKRGKGKEVKVKRIHLSNRHARVPEAAVMYENTGNSAAFWLGEFDGPSSSMENGHVNGSGTVIGSGNKVKSKLVSESTPKTTKPRLKQKKEGTDKAEVETSKSTNPPTEPEPKAKAKDTPKSKNPTPKTKTKTKPPSPSPPKRPISLSDTSDSDSDSDSASSSSSSSSSESDSDSDSDSESSDPSQNGEYNSSSFDRPPPKQPATPTVIKPAPSSAPPRKKVDTPTPKVDVAKTKKRISLLPTPSTPANPPTLKKIEQSDVNTPTSTPGEKKKRSSLGAGGSEKKKGRGKGPKWVTETPKVK